MNTNDMYYNTTNLTEETFINRTEIRNTLKKYYNCFNIDSTNMFKVFYIYGFGGMGKTHLIKYLKNDFLKTIPAKIIIHITFEIQENNQLLYSLIKIRKTFNHPCPIFDYALLYYWNLERIEKLNDEFVKILKQDILSAYADMGINLMSLGNSSSSISFGGIHDIINDMHMKIQNHRVKTEIHDIIQMEGSEILNNLPVFLARDIKEYMHCHSMNYIFLFDSYQQSAPYSESEEWLLHFINELQKGLFIITGREKLLWESTLYKIEKYYLDVYPEEDARSFLGTIIPPSNSEVLDTIIKVSGCIPIYVALAYDLYKQEQNVTPNQLIEKVKFTDRRKLVQHFINHLKNEWQDIILYLAAIRIFNNDIFEYLIDDLHLPCSKLDFDEIINVSLFKYIENSNGFYKLHDVISDNAVYILKSNKVNKIFDSYLRFIAQRGIYINLMMNDLEAMLTLFTNILEICINDLYAIQINQKIIEEIIDLFLIISDTRIVFPLPKPSPNYSIELNDMLYFMNAIAFEKENTNNTIENLRKIEKPILFGKHFKSYNIILKYEESLIGNYQSLKEYLEQLKIGLTEADQAEWYYLKTYIYLSDYYMMEGDFVQSYQCLEKLRAFISLNIYHTDNYFLIERSIGHIYRFNYDFEEANKRYKELLKLYNKTPSLKVYLLVNLCETKCFINPDYVIRNFSEALEYTERFHNLKNKAKLYYARGIAFTLLHKYTEAMDDINISIHINERDGYLSGKLFAYQAKAFCEYAKNGYISKPTLEEITLLVKKLKVYEFLLYPLHLIQNTINNPTDIKWINPSKTEANCKAFIKRLRS